MLLVLPPWRKQLSKIIFIFLNIRLRSFCMLNKDKLYVFVSAINRGEIKDTEMEAIMDTIVDSLFSVFATLGIYFLYFVLTDLLLA
jgi:hypothetical protein